MDAFVTQTEMKRAETAPVKPTTPSTKKRKRSDRPKPLHAEQSSPTELLALVRAEIRLRLNGRRTEINLCSPTLWRVQQEGILNFGAIDVKLLVQEGLATRSPSKEELETVIIPENRSIVYSSVGVSNARISYNPNRFQLMYSRIDPIRPIYINRVHYGGLKLKDLSALLARVAELTRFKPQARLLGGPDISSRTLVSIKRQRRIADDSIVYRLQYML